MLPAAELCAAFCRMHGRGAQAHRAAARVCEVGGFRALHALCMSADGIAHLEYSCTWSGVSAPHTCACLPGACSSRGALKAMCFKGCVCAFAGVLQKRRMARERERTAQMRVFARWVLLIDAVT